MILPSVRALRSGDCAALAAMFPADEALLSFEDAYVQQLQGNRLVLVAVHRDEDGQRTYYGQAQLIWKSEQTYFWQRNIPQLLTAAVQVDHRRQGIGTKLVQSAIIAVREHGDHGQLGVHLTPQVDTAARQWLTALGFASCEDEEAHLCCAVQP